MWSNKYCAFQTIGFSQFSLSVWFALPRSLNIVKKILEFVSGVFFRYALGGRHCLPQVIITSITHLKILVFFSILCCLSLSNEKGTFKSALLNQALRSSSCDVLSLWVLVLLCSSVFSLVLFHLLKHGRLLNKDVDDVASKTHDKQNTWSLLL